MARSPKAPSRRTERGGARRCERRCRRRYTSAADAGGSSTSIVRRIGRIVTRRVASVRSPPASATSTSSGASLPSSPQPSQRNQASSVVPSAASVVNPAPQRPRHGCTSSIKRRHGRTSGRSVGEEDDVADRLDAGQHHHQPVDPDAEAAGRRHAVLERPQVVLVDRPPLGVTGVTGSLLLLEALALLDRVVELAVAVGQLAGVGEQLEALGEERVVAVDPGERGDLHRVPGDEHRGGDVRLDGRFEQLLDQLAGTPLRLPSHAVPLGQRADVARRAATGGPPRRSPHRRGRPSAASGSRPARSTSCPRICTTVVPSASRAARTMSSSVSAITSVTSAYAS